MSYVKMRQFVCFECGHEELHYSLQPYIVCPECFEPNAINDDIIDDELRIDIDELYDSE